MQMKRCLHLCELFSYVSKVAHLTTDILIVEPLTLTEKISHNNIYTFRKNVK